MKQRTPMSRGQGFKRPESRPGVRPERVTKWPSALVERARAAITSIADACIAQPKEQVETSPAYVNLVLSLPCQRCGWPPRSQFCHTDEGKGIGIKTDVRRGWAGCGPRPGSMGCHYLVGTSGTFTKLQRRAEDERLAALTRAEIIRLGKWPKKLPFYTSNPASGQ